MARQKRNELIQQLNRLCNERRLSQRAIARAVGVSQQTVSRWFRGIDLPNDASVAGIARAYPELMPMAVGAILASVTNGGDE